MAGFGAMAGGGGGGAGSWEAGGAGDEVQQWWFTHTFVRCAPMDVPTTTRSDVRSEIVFLSDEVRRRGPLAHAFA
eukprot:1178919-Prorocentrum_minimum.AAC.6